MTEIRGILPAVVTPFDENGRFLSASFEKLLLRLYSADVDGVYVCGQTGEGLLQTVQQREMIADAAVRLSPEDKLVIIHVGANSLTEAVRLARHAARTGADAISSLPPKNARNFNEVKTYYEKLAAVSQLPVLAYYFPSGGAAVWTTEELSELCRIPNVVGLKFTDYDLFKLSSLKKRSTLVFNGRDEVLAAGLLMGADGGIGSFYNVLPELFVQLYRYGLAREWELAREVQSTINELIEIALRFPVFPAIKCMLEWSGIQCGTCLPPHRKLSVGEQDDLRSSVAKSSLAEKNFVAQHIA